MREHGPGPEVQKTSVLSGEFAVDLTNPSAYMEVAKDGMEKLKRLLASAEI